MSGRSGLLTLARGQGTYARHAVLRDPETSAELMRLYNAGVEKVSGGGLLVRGEDMHFRGTKSKGEPSRQAWWVVPAGAQR